MKEEGDWYCAYCDKFLISERVTYEETCDTCGQPVEWLSLDEMKKRGL